MLYYDKIDVSGEIDVNKTSVSKECDICHYWHFLNKGFKFQPYVYNGCHDILMMSINLSDVSVLNIHSVDYHCNISRISKSKTVNLLQSADLTRKKDDMVILVIWKLKCINFNKRKAQFQYLV